METVCWPHNEWSLDSNLKLAVCSPAAATAAKLLQSCPTLCDPIDSSPPVFSIPGMEYYVRLKQIPKSEKPKINPRQMAVTKSGK